MENLRALLAMHNRSWEKVGIFLLKKEGYEISIAKNVDEMKSLMDISQEGFPRNFFSLYMMDTNLGFSGADTFEPAEEIFKLIKKDYDNKKVKFLSITGNPDLVENAKNKGIPCFNKAESEKISDYIIG